MVKRKEHVFKPYNNPTIDYINYKHEKIKLVISWNVEFSFNIDLFIDCEIHSFKLPPISSKEKLFSSDEINFDGLELHSIEKDQIARRLNEILNFNFD